MSSGFCLMRGASAGQTTEAQGTEAWHSQPWLPRDSSFHYGLEVNTAVAEGTPTLEISAQNIMSETSQEFKNYLLDTQMRIKTINLAIATGRVQGLLNRK